MQCATSALTLMQTITLTFTPTLTENDCLTLLNVTQCESVNTASHTENNLITYDTMPTRDGSVPHCDCSHWRQHFPSYTVTQDWRQSITSRHLDIMVLFLSRQNLLCRKSCHCRG